MLKELWRKTLGQDAAPVFGQAGSRGADKSRNAAKKRGFRMLPQMTHTGEFHLQRLTHLIEVRYGKSFPGEGDEGVRQMIQYAARIQDQDVQRELLLFYLNCSPVIQEYLRSEQILGTDHPFTL
jgi:hypothetical protein